MNYQRIYTLLAVRGHFNASQTTQEIATSANNTPSTIRRWLKVAA